MRNLCQEDLTDSRWGVTGRFLSSRSVSVEVIWGEFAKERGWPLLTFPSESETELPPRAENGLVLRRTRKWKSILTHC